MWLLSLLGLGAPLFAQCDTASLVRQVVYPAALGVPWRRAEFEGFRAAGFWMLIDPDVAEDVHIEIRIARSRLHPYAPATGADRIIPIDYQMADLSATLACATEHSAVHRLARLPNLITYSSDQDHFLRGRYLASVLSEWRRRAGRARFESPRAALRSRLLRFFQSSQSESKAPY
jgi:hypothetical protein